VPSALLSRPAALRDLRSSRRRFVAWTLHRVEAALTVTMAMKLRPFLFPTAPKPRRHHHLPWFLLPRTSVPHPPIRDFTQTTRSFLVAMTSSIDKILSRKYPAKAHAEKVTNYIRTAHPEIADGLIYLESAHSTLYEDCDQEGYTPTYRSGSYS